MRSLGRSHACGDKRNSRRRSSPQEEKGELEKELEKLQAELIGLTYRALSRTAARSRGDSQHPRRALHRDSTEDVLRDAIKIQQLSLASVQAVLSTYVLDSGVTADCSFTQSHHKVSPIQTPIRLRKDVAARCLTLQGLKAEKLAEGKRFLAARSRGMDMTTFYAEEERFETDDGGFCVLRFDITPLPGARSVKALFDALLYFIFNIEISISESMGNITIREDDESGEQSISHHRFVTTNQEGVQVELSSVHFSDFDESSGDGLGSGVIVADFVDDDEMYPYRPSERLRNDLTAVLTVTPERRKVESKDYANGPEVEDVVVTLTRWSLVKLHRSEFAIPDDALQSLRERHGRWWDEMIKTLREKTARE